MAVHWFGRTATIRFFILLITLVMYHSGGYEAEAQTVDDVAIRGNERVEDSTILLQVSTKPGEVFEQAKIEHDIKEIFKTGFFDQVSAKRESLGSGRSMVMIPCSKGTSPS